MAGCVGRLQSTSTPKILWDMILIAFNTGHLKPQNVDTKIYISDSHIVSCVTSLNMLPVNWKSVGAYKNVLFYISSFADRRKAGKIIC